MENDIIKLTAYNNIDGVRKAIEAGADINIQNKYGDTALKIASVYNWINIAYFLVKAGADLNIQDENGRTLLMEAVYYGRRNELIKILLKGGADKDIKNNKGETAFDIAKRQGNQEMVELLTPKN